MENVGQFYVWYRSNGEIVGIGTVLLATPPRLGIALLSDDTERLSLLKVEAGQRPDPAKPLEQFWVVDGELREKDSY